MCGIAGIIETCERQKDFDLMLQQLMHRGPDGSGTHSIEEAMLGHARLSIIDVEGGKQPILNEDGSICIIFNGEIYNHRELRTLLRSPHVFKTNTDTEVILHLYEEMGEECVRLLDGMFAFAIYDENRGLLLARDPIGIKPLYVGLHEESICFASEMKALQDVVPDFEEFPAGHYYVTGQGVQNFFAIAARGPEIATIEHAEKGLKHYLKRAVGKRLMSDVPLGVFLSGGLDSSIIAAIVAESCPKLDTFTVGFVESEDRDYARMCSEYIGSNHHERLYTVEDMLAVLPEVIYSLESYDAALVRSAVPNYFLAQLAAEHVKVALTGEGADELFGGYHYLKDFSQDDLQQELLDITGSLHNTNLQRCDRMSMAHGLEARVPFLDIDLVCFAFGLPMEFKLGPDHAEKWLLRKAFSGYLPDEIANRRKSKFSEGCGSCHALLQVAEDSISDAEFQRCSDLPDGRTLRNKEELMYYRIFKKFFPSDSAHRAIGFSHSL